MICRLSLTAIPRQRVGDPRYEVIHSSSFPSQVLIAMTEFIMELHPHKAVPMALFYESAPATKNESPEMEPFIKGDGQVKAMFVVGTMENVSYIAIRVMFARAETNFATYVSIDRQPAAFHAVSVRLKNGTYDISAAPAGEKFVASLPKDILGPATVDSARNLVLAEITLRTGCRPKIDGFGLPFIGKTAEIDHMINANSKINGRQSLLQTLQQRKFIFVISGEDLPDIMNNFGFPEVELETNLAQQ